MALFEKFTDTVFYKTENDLERKIEILTELQKKYPENDEIKRQLFLSKRGLQGEKQIIYELKNANIGMYVLHDITIRSGDSIAQIDFIVVTPYKNYFIECKDLIGDITVNNNGQFVRTYKWNGQTIKKSIYSPLTQAETHINIFLKNWKDRHNFLDNLFYSRYVEKYNVPLVVMANSEGILNTKFAPKEIKSKVITSDQLLKYIQNDKNRANRDELCGKRQMEKIAKKFKEIDDPIVRDYENMYVKQEEKNNLLISKLKEYRTKKASERKIPEDYIFTDEELDKILSIMPTEIDQLKDILSDIKVKYHGKEIIDIIKCL